MTTDDKALPREKISINGQERDVLPKDTLLNNRYKIKKVLGHGSMGAVYLGIYKELEGRVAIKENLFLTEAGRQDFENEAKLLFRLKNDHLPRVFDRFEADGRQYLVMDFVDGRNLYELIRPDAAKPAAPLPLPQALEYMIQVCEAVAYLHRQTPPIIHHDIKPQNIKVTPAGEVVLVDFGLAKEGDSAGGQGLTFGFAPPEQYTGRTATGIASDIYALGATLYALVTGQRPPDSQQLAIGQADLKPAQTLNPAISSTLAEAIAQAMRIKPADRPASVAAWRAQLQAILAEISQPPGVDNTKPEAGGGRRLGGLKEKQTGSPLSLGVLVISGVVGNSGLDSADQDFVNTELKWLFNAADNFQKIRRGELTPTQPIAATIPPTAQLEPGANNHLLNTIDSFSLQIWAGQLDSAFKRIQIHLRNLDILLAQESKKGDAGKGDVYLQNQIKGARLEIVKILQELAGLMKEAYGVFVTGPNQLIEFLE